MNLEVLSFEWDENNLRHVLVDSPHGITPAVVAAVGGKAARLFPNAQRVVRSGSHMMIGPDNDGRMWTIVLLDRGSGSWRPITGWPSTASEIRRFNGEE